MSKNNDNFFAKKKIWSEVKDELLAYYLVPYFNKILRTGKPILYVDCFAGKGKFDDGKPGSPLMAIKSLETSLGQYHGNRAAPPVTMKFIELNHSKDLEANIPEPQLGMCEVITGRFQDQIAPLITKAVSTHPSQNVFFYIDPYGVKVLNAALLDQIANAFTTAELLINLNSFGFIREACRVKNVQFRESEDDIFGDLEEYDYSALKSINELNAIAGGDYWQQIIEAYQAKKINCYEAEKEFSLRYKERLREKYKYVLDMPIRLKPGHHPKYRMVHATNHPDGCVLMAENIAKRTDRLVVEVQGGGQGTLFSETADNEYASDNELTQKVKSILDETTEFTRLNTFLANFYNKYGVLCDVSRLTTGKGGSILKSLEKSGYVDIQRDPATTLNGSSSTFWGEHGKQTIQLRKRAREK